MPERDRASRLSPNAQLARDYLQGGLSLVAIKTDGSKSPPVKAWECYQHKPPSITEVVGWLSQGFGIAIIGGEVSQGLEILDFDAAELFSPWSDVVEELAPGLLQRLPVVQTPNGRHVYYRCNEIAGNTKLAQGLNEHGKIKTLIETRGEAGYVLSPLCPPACHPLHKCYVLLDGDLTDIPRITPDERTMLWNAARTFNAYEPPERLVTTPGPAASPTGERPGDIYAARVTWAEILEPEGWTRVGQRGEVTLWERPGKQERGWSATTGYGADVLYVFSSNAAPFEPEHAYSKFAAYTLLAHNGDFEAAAKALYTQGYRGERHKSPESNHPLDRGTPFLKRRYPVPRTIVVEVR
jgi:hypothetical protein